MRRALETCALAGFGARAAADDDLREWDYGDDEGRTTEEIRRDRPGWTLWADGVPGGETIEQVAARADRVLSRARAAAGGADGASDVLVFAHGHLLRVLAARWLGAEPAFGAHLVLGPAAPSVLGWERDTPALLRWNDGGSGPIP